MIFRILLFWKEKFSFFLNNLKMDRFLKVMSCDLILFHVMYVIL